MHCPEPLATPERLSPMYLFQRSFLANRPLLPCYFLLPLAFSLLLCCVPVRVVDLLNERALQMVCQNNSLLECSKKSECEENRGGKNWMKSEDFTEGQGRNGWALFGKRRNPGRHGCVGARSAVTTPRARFAVTVR